MPLTLVLGPANSAKAGEVLSAFAAHAEREAVLVVPTAADIAHYRAELASGGLARGLIVTPMGLAGEIARRVGRDACVLSDPGRRAVLARALARIDWEALGDSAAGTGFPAAALALVTELERALVTPQRFAQALRVWADGTAGRRAYARDLGRIVTGYAAELERLGAEDAELFAWRALDALRAAPERWGRTPVFLYGFDDLSRTERDAIEVLTRVVGADVTVSLTYEPGREALRARGEVVEALRATADTVRELPARDDHYASGAREVLHHLERTLFGPPAERLDPGDAVVLLEAGGELAQAELVAAEVRRLLDSGCPAAEIAVVVRSLSAGGPVLRSALAACAVPVDEERRLALAHTALGRAVIGLARLALAPDAEAADLLALLRYPGRAAPDAVDALEAVLRRAGVRSATAALTHCGLAVPEVAALRAAADPAGELVELARGLLAAGRRGTAPILPAGEALDARALGVLARELAAASAALGGLAEPDVLAMLATLAVPLPSPAPGGVRLAEPLAIRARRFRAVFVVGLNEGEFPLGGVDDPFLPDRLRRELAQASGLRLPLAGDRLDRERYLLYAAVSRADEWLRLSFRGSDEEGNRALASPFLEEIAERYVPDWTARARRRRLADVTWAAAEAPNERERRRAAAAAREGRDPVPAAPRELGAGALAHVRHTEVVSANALESHLRCPVRWLVERQLGPARFEPEPEPMARGSYLHAVLEQVFAGLGEPLGPASLPRALERLEGAVAAVPDHALAPGRPAGVRAALIAGLEADLRRYLEQEAADDDGFVPAHTELRFGIDDVPGALPALQLGDAHGGVAVRGVIDRVDVDREGGRRAVVRDYKSGARRADQAVARWAEDGNLQVALYMLAVRRLLGLEPVAGLYQPLRGPDLRPRGVYREGEPLGARVVGSDARDPEALDAELASAEARAVEVADAIRSGRLEPRPGTCSREGCAYPGICRP